MKRLEKKGLLGLIVILSLTLVLNGCKAEDGKKDELKSDELKSDVFKTMETVDLKGDKVISSVFSENDLTLVNVWNKGCTPCIEELPILDKLNNEYKGKGVAIKGLYYGFEEGISDEDRGEVETILSEGNIEYEQWLASKDMAESKSLKKLTAFATTYFVNDKGEIVDFIEGSSDYDGWKERIENVLKEVK